MSSSTSVSPGKRYYGKQDPWSSVVTKDRSGQPDSFSSTEYSKLDYDRVWSAETDFGQTDFGHPHLTDFGQNLGARFWPNRLWPILVF